MYLLAKYTDVQDKVAEEIRSVIGKDRKPTGIKRGEEEKGRGGERRGQEEGEEERRNLTFCQLRILIKCRTSTKSSASLSAIALLSLL